MKKASTLGIQVSNISYFRHEYDFNFLLPLLLLQITITITLTITVTSIPTITEFTILTAISIAAASIFIRIVTKVYGVQLLPTLG